MPFITSFGEKLSPNRILNYTITTAEHDMSIHDFLKSRGYSRVIITHLKRTENGILRNGKWARVSECLLPGDRLSITILETSPSSNIIPVDLGFSIVYEDEDLMIVDKPADMPIHPSQGNYDNTLANAVAYYYATTKEQPFVYRCINRLDRDTAGLLILAKHMYSASLLGTMMKQRQIHREYRAVVTGFIDEEGCIEAPIARADGSTIERCVDFEHGEYARTHYRRLSYKNGYSLVSLTLDTGRTHQIRVHMKHIGHPLPGDFLYNPDYTHFTRQPLQSYRLEFHHPISGAPLTFKLGTEFF